MSIFGRVLKALQIIWSGSVGSNWSMLWSGRSGYDYSGSVGDGTGSSIVVACIGWVCRAFPEAPVQVVKIDPDGTETVLYEHPMTMLLAHPNKFYSGELLWKATLSDLQSTGNAYWVKVRNGAGRPVELWWTPQSLMEPQWPDDGSVYISHYAYKPGNEAYELPVEDVVHFRDGLDPSNTRKGMSPLAALLREIYTDEEAANYSATILRNMGVPGVVISPGSDIGELSPDDANQLKADFQEKFSGDRRGEPLVLSTKASIIPLSFNPQQLSMKDLRRIPEERVSAVLGVPAIVAGLGAGLDRSTFANYAEARESAYESNIIPTQRLLAGEMKAQLLDDFGDTARLRVRFDVSNVRVLQEDQTRIWTRADMAVRGGWLTVARAKELVGEKPEPTDGVYLRGMGIMETRPGQVAPAAAPAEEPEEEPPTEDDTLFEGVRGAETKAGHRPGVEVYGSKEHGDLWSTFIQRVRKWVFGLSEPVQGLLREQQEEILAELGTGTADDPFDMDAWKTKFEQTVRPIIGTVVQEAGQIALQDIGVEQVFDIFEPRMVTFLNNRAQRFAEQVNDTTWRALQESLGQGITGGESIPELSERVLSVMGDRIRSTPETIARTEVIGAANGGTLEAWEQSDVVKGKMWLSALDDRTRSYAEGDEFDHYGAHGEVVGLDEQFQLTGEPMDHPGGDGSPGNVINCRCTMTAVL